jgi:muconolactone delta-isomerase
MKILALEKPVPGVTQEQFTGALLKEEAARAWELLQSGIIRELYFRSDKQRAILFLECATSEEAGRALSTLPLVRDRLIAFELIPLVAYPGFARLFQGT